MQPPELPRYEILAELGQGGMSVVYRARDRQLGRQVAVKVLLPHLARQAEARRRFHREAQAVAKLHHPNIVEIFDYSGPEAEPAYIVTELIEAGTLRDFVEARGGKLREPELALLITHTIAKALVHAHECGVIHRDIKPENVMFTQKGELKLVDFGIAQLDGSGRLTATGALLGSPAHMAPEVIDGARPDERSDLYSLGTVLYWLATGELPFAAPNPSALFKQILGGQYPDPQMHSPRIGNGLLRIIQKLLATDPSERWSSGAELIHAITSELEPLGLGATEEELALFLENPDTYALELGHRLVERLAALGRAAQQAGQLGRAMDFYNRVLARQPDHPEVRRAVERLTRRQDLGRSARHLGLALAATAFLAAAAYGLANRATLEEPQSLAPPPLAELRPGPAPVGTGTVADLTRPPPRQVVPPVAKLPLPRNTKVLRRPRAPDDAGTISVSGPSPDAGPGPTPDAAVLAELRREARLLVVIGGSYADVALRPLDGRAQESYPGVVKRSLTLAPGRYELDVAKPGYGRFRTRRFEVREDGEISEERPDGSLRPLPSPLRLRIPGPSEPKEEHPDWIPETG